MIHRMGQREKIVQKRKIVIAQDHHLEKSFIVVEFSIERIKGKFDILFKLGV